MGIYENNLEAIQLKNHKIYQAILKEEYEPEDIAVEAENARNGMPIMKVIQEDTAVYMNSQYDPEKEAVKFVGQYRNVLDYSVMFFVGFGNPYAVKQLLDTLGEHVTLVFYEPSIAIFQQTIRQYDVVDIINDDRVKLFVKGFNTEQYVGEWSQIITYENYRVCIFDALPKYRKLFPEDCEEVEEVYSHLVHMIMVNVETSAHFAQDKARNDIYNMRHFANCNCEQDFEGVLPTDIPAIIVAAGPSLEKNVMLLKEAKGKALIIAVDTIFKYLIERDIKPDLVVSADPRKAVRLFAGMETTGVPLAMDSSLNYKAVDIMAQEKVIFISSENSYYHMMFQLVGKTMYSLASGGSVATLAFALAVTWGFRRLVLVGQDLALAPDKVHAGNVGTQHGRLQGELIPVEGYYGDTVYTSPDYHQYLDWYNVVGANNKELEIINATEGGANIRATVKMTLREVIDTYCTEEYDFEQAIKDMPPSFLPEQKDLYVNRWKESVENLTAIGYQLVKGARLADKGIKTINTGKYSAKEIQKIQNEIDAILEDCESKEEIYFVDCMVAEKEKDILGDLYRAEANNDDEYCRILEKLKKYMNSMESAIDEVKEMFNTLITVVSNEDSSGSK